MSQTISTGRENHHCKIVLCHKLYLPEEKTTTAKLFYVTNYIYRKRKPPLQNYSMSQTISSGRENHHCKIALCHKLYLPEEKTTTAKLLLKFKRTFFSFHSFIQNSFICLKYN
jgi:hypothetical protein